MIEIIFCIVSAILLASIYIYLFLSEPEDDEDCEEPTELW